MVKHDKSEQTDITAEEYELDDCLLESNDIVITQNKDGFVLHVKKLGNITTSKLGATAAAEEEQHQQQQLQTTNTGAVTLSSIGGGGSAQTSATLATTITELQQLPIEVKPTLTTLTSSHQAIKLPSTECELINLKKIIPASTTISTHPSHVTTTIIQPHQLQQQQVQHHQQQQHQHIQQIATTSQQQQQQQQLQHQLQQQQSQHAEVQSIVTTQPGGGGAHTINLMSLRNVQITEQKPIVSRIKYSRGKIITTPTAAGGTVQIVEAHDALTTSQHHEITDGTKYEISEIDLNNPNTSAAIISDLVKYAEIDDIELPDGTKIGIGFAPTEIPAEHHIQTTVDGTQITTIEHEPHQVATIHHHHHHQQQQQHHETEQQQQQHLQHHIQQQTQQQQHTQIEAHHIQQQQQQQIVQTEAPQIQLHHHHHQLQESEDVETIIPDAITIHDQTKSYTILTTRPMKSETSDIGIGETTTTTYELSLSDSSLGPVDDPEARYICRHCGKKYRWKSTLRRHENVECGGKEPCHPCPYCTYKAKQRGNLGVHVRKHHPEKPQLESKRGRKI